MPPQMMEADETLVARMSVRDQSALSALYDRHRGVLFALCLRILRDRAEAEEILGDVFMQAWRQSSGYDRARGSVAAWLVNLARSRAIDRLRARSRRQSGSEAYSREEAILAEASPGPIGPEAAAEHGMKKKRIEAALETLSPQQREAIELAYYEGLSHSEVALKLEQPLGTVKTRIRRGLIQLRESLGSQFGS